MDPDELAYNDFMFAKYLDELEPPEPEEEYPTGHDEYDRY
jgi:hypothetical protein